MRAGAYSLSLLSDPLDARLIRALAYGPLSLADLRREVGSPPETTLRSRLQVLTDLGALTRARQQRFPSPVSYEMSQAGRDLTFVASAVARWLATCPDGALTLGTPAAKGAIKALIDGWSTKILRALAAKPLALTELDRILSDINYPALERRLTALRLTGQIVPVRTRGGSTPYNVTAWLREGVAPLFAAATWERHHLPATCPPFGRLDIETAFLLALPLVDLPTDSSGSARLAVEFSNDKESDFAGATITVANGHLTSCVSGLRGNSESSASGPSTAWLSALSGGDERGIEFDGRHELASAVFAGLRRVLAWQLVQPSTT